MRGDHCGAYRAQRSHRRARRRRDRRSRRLCRGQRAARARFRAGADDAARPSRFIGRRQDRHQFPSRQEFGRRLPSADFGGRRHRVARHFAETRIPRRLCRDGQVRAARRRGVLLLAGGELAGRILRRRRRASTPSRSAAAARPASWRATSAKPASARCSISATPSVTRWRPAPASPAACCTARRSRSAPCWRSSSPPARA